MLGIRRWGSHSRSPLVTPLLAVHLGKETSHCHSVCGSECAKFVAESFLADGAYLINRYFGLLVRHTHHQPRAPGRVQLRREWAHGYGQ